MKKLVIQGVGSSYNGVGSILNGVGSKYELLGFISKGVGANCGTGVGS